MTNDKIHGLSSTVKQKLEVTQYSFELSTLSYKKVAKGI